MLPQFGYIVAQAGADSHHSNKTSTKSTSSSSSQLTKPYSNFTRHTSPTPMLPPPLPYMYQQPPPPPPPPARDDYAYRQPNTWHSSPQYQQQQQQQQQQQSSSVWQPPAKEYDDTRWQPELTENKMVRRIRESNDLITRMDTEFWEQCDDIYREKLDSLQNEIIMIQLGTHYAYKQSLADLELIREQTTDFAELYQDYELSLIQKQYQQDMKLVNEDYEQEKYSLHDSILQAIEEKRKQVKEDKDEEEEFVAKAIFKDAYQKLSLKRNPRKRTQYDSPSRQEKRKRDRQATPHNIYAAPTTVEEEQLETDFILMKGGNPAKRQRR